MHKDKLQQFLQGEINAEHIQNELEENSVEKDFIDSYRQVIREDKTEVPKFDPFEKIKKKKTKRISFAQRLLPYAATISLLVCLFFFSQEIQFFNKQDTLTTNELNELKINTEQSLLLFSRELNTCIAEIEKSQKTMPSFSTIYSIEHFNIEFNNIIKTRNIN